MGRMEVAVSRVLLAFFLYAGGATPAPQDSSSITYVRPLPEAIQAQSPQTQGPVRDARDSRIEKLPLIIGGSEETVAEVVSDSLGDISTLSVPQYTKQDTTVSEPATTEAGPNEPTEPAEPAEPTEPNSLPSPRFVSKLSYFNKANQFGSAHNFVERTGKRKFRSRCRCEKIWNCPKLQITVPRCPDEYFLCCF